MDSLMAMLTLDYGKLRSRPQYKCQEKTLQSKAGSPAHFPMAMLQNLHVPWISHQGLTETAQGVKN